MTGPKTQSTAPEPELVDACAGVLDGRNLAVLNTTLRGRGVSDNDRHEILNLFRNVNFEPATDTAFSIEKCLRQAETCFERGIPAIVSVHSINFHSTVQDNRSGTIAGLDQFLAALEAKHADLLYLHDEDLLQSLTTGSYRTQNETTALNVSKKMFFKSMPIKPRKAQA